MLRFMKQGVICCPAVCGGCTETKRSRTTIILIPICKSINFFLLRSKTRFRVGDRFRYISLSCWIWIHIQKLSTDSSPNIDKFINLFSIHNILFTFKYILVCSSTCFLSRKPSWNMKKQIVSHNKYIRATKLVSGNKKT